MFAGLRNRCYAVGCVAAALLAAACSGSASITSDPASTSTRNHTTFTFGTVPAATIPRGTSGGHPKTGLTLYSGQHPQTVDALVREFEQETGIGVAVRRGSEGSLANQLLQEGSDTPADVFFAENPPALNVLDERHLLAKTAASTLAKVGRQYSPRSGDWVGVSARAVAFAYNKSKLSAAALPRSIRDLARSSWKGKLGLAPSEGDFQPLVTTIINRDGRGAAKRWLEGLKSNSVIYDSNESLLAAVDRGEVIGGIIDHYYFYRLGDEVGEQRGGRLHSALHYFATGDPGSLVDVSGAGQLAASKHAAAAQRFLAFLVSAPAQQIIAASESYEYPLGSGVTTTKKIRPFGEFGSSPMSIEDLGDGKSALDLLLEVGLL